MLMSKKTLCESVTKSCVAVADKVWDTFLKDVAPQLKNAEIIAEDKARQDCIGSISECFQKACKENIDEKDPDGSYDLCLTRPESMLHLCKIPLNACGIDASSRESAEQSNIWDYVLAALASMRVNACTTELKDCLQADDRCGKDYTKCIGLDTDTIIRLCPYDKLMGCQKVYGAENVRDDDVYDELFNMVRGIMVNIDNNFLKECQNALTEATIRVCGDADDCTSKTTNQYIGAQTLAYNICPYVIVGDDVVVAGENCYKDQTEIPDELLGRVEGSKTGHMGPVTPFAGKLDGVIYWSSVEVDSQGKYSTIDEYIETAQLKDVMTPLDRERVQNELNALQQGVDGVIAAIESDPTVQYCMTGRAVKGMKDIKMEGSARFPELTKQTRMIIANGALSVAKKNYYKKYDELSERLLIDYGKIAARQAEIRGENKKDAYREAARQACISMAQISALPRSPTPPGGVIGKIIIGVIIVAAIVVASIFTFGAAGIAAGAGAGAMSAAAEAGAGLVTVVVKGGMAYAGSLATSAVIAGVATGVGAAAVVAETALVATTKDTTAKSKARPTQLTGYYEMNQWNYKEKISTKFNWDDIECEKCIEAQYCTKPSVPVFGNTKCKRWGDPETKCTTTKF